MLLSEQEGTDTPTPEKPVPESPKRERMALRKAIPPAKKAAIGVFLPLPRWFACTGLIARAFLFSKNPPRMAGQVCQ